MVYRAGKKKLERIRKVLEGETNEVWITQDMEGKGQKDYGTLLVVKKHKTAKLFMEILEEGRKNGRISHASTFSCQDEFCVLYPYTKERLLDEFYKGGRYSGEECRQICMNLAAECLSVEEPWQILYLMLDQGQIHIQRDRSISLGYEIDLSRLKSNVDERACAMKCAGKILWMMQQNHDMEHTAGINLIQKKLQKEGYSSFAELFRDIRIDSGFWEKRKKKRRMTDFFRRKWWIMMRFLLILSAFLGILAALMIFSQMAFGDIPFFRIFSNSFEKIGTESLVN